MNVFAVNHKWWLKKEVWSCPVAYRMLHALGNDTILFRGVIRTRLETRLLCAGDSRETMSVALDGGWILDVFNAGVAPLAVSLHRLRLLCLAEPYSLRSRD